MRTPGAGSSSHTEHPLEPLTQTHQCFAEQVKLLYAHAPVVFIATVANAVLLASVQWEVVPRSILIGWLCLILVVTAWRVLLVYRYRRSQVDPETVNHWWRQFLIGTALAGISWGASGIFLFPQDSIVHQAFLAFVLGGMTAGAISTNSSRLECSIVFVVPNLIPLIARLFLVGDHVHLTMGGMITFFMVLMLFIARRFYHTTTTSLELRFERTHLIERMTEAKERAERLNAELAHQVAMYAEAEEALREAHQELELQVEKRTAKLSASEAELKEANRKLNQTLEQLKAVQQQIVRRERLLAVGQMTSGIAHNFNNALQPILGFSELLLTEPAMLEDKATVLNFLGLIHQSAKGAAEVIKRLRGFSRDEKVLQPIALNPLIQEVIDLTQLQWKNDALAHGKTITVQKRLTGNPVVYGNKAELGEVLMNLVFNAIDAFHENGTITISTEVEGGQVVIRVKDTGMGMTPETQVRCFEPFFSTKEEKGTGLGLWISFGVIEKHQGTIQVESEVGKGCTFTIRLPLQRESCDDDAIKGEKLRLAPLHVLLVEGKTDA